MRVNTVQFAIIIFLTIIVIAHIFAPDQYDWKRNTISDLGSQGTETKIIMQLGFLIFGVMLSLGLLSNGLSWRRVPVFFYAICVGLTGIFCTKPFIPELSYSQLESNLHSLFAQIAGITFSIGILTQVLYTNITSEKWTHSIFFILIILLSALFGYFQSYQGILQRVLYLISFLWLSRYF